MNLTAEEQQKVDDLRVAVTPHAAVRIVPDVDGVIWPPLQPDLQLISELVSAGRPSRWGSRGVGQVQADHFMFKGQRWVACERTLHMADGIAPVPLHLPPTFCCVMVSRVRRTPSSCEHSSLTRRW